MHDTTITRFDGSVYEGPIGEICYDKDVFLHSYISLWAQEDHAPERHYLRDIVSALTENQRMSTTNIGTCDELEKMAENWRRHTSGEVHWGNVVREEHKLPRVYFNVHDVGRIVYLSIDAEGTNVGIALGASYSEIIGTIDEVLETSLKIAIIPRNIGPIPVGWRTEKFISVYYDKILAYKFIREVIDTSNKLSTIKDTSPKGNKVIL